MRQWNDKTGGSKYFIFMHLFINIPILKKVCEAAYGDCITRNKISGWKENKEKEIGINLGKVKVLYTFIKSELQIWLWAS